MKKIIALALIAVSLCLILTSCGSSKALIGTWKPRDMELGDDYVLVFENGGTGTYFGEAITWKVKGNKLSIAFEGTTDMEMEFKVDGDVFCFKDSTGEDTYWVRVK